MHFPVFGYVIITFDYYTQRQVAHILNLDGSDTLSGKRRYDLNGKPSGYSVLQFYVATWIIFLIAPENEHKEVPLETLILKVKSSLAKVSYQAYAASHYFPGAAKR